jgi:transaldolase
VRLYRSPLIQGITTNPTLMRKAGITDYERFAREVLEVVKTKPVSFEVLSDDFAEMRRQAKIIGGWQENVFVKIPITNALNVTALLTIEQVEAVATHLATDVPAIVSIFAGRIADTGLDPVPVMRKSRMILAGLPSAELLWGSVREILNIFQAAESGAQIVTVGHEFLEKAERLVGKDLIELSRETVQMFHDDARAAGYRL